METGAGGNDRNSEFRFSPRPNRAGDINWQHWGREAFDRAVQEQKPVLLSISAVWCHWCHVMDETSLSDPDVIAAINRDFVPIRVDNDKHPEVNGRYNMGGWPTIAVLTPEGDVITGATYLPPDTLKSFLEQVRAFLDQNRPEIYAGLLELKQAATRKMEPARPGELSDDVVNNVSRALLAVYDPVCGGFGSEPKFPLPDALELLIERYHRFGDTELREAIDKTLASMARGGMFDQVEGGFFRYSTHRDWSVPHYEKMLEDNAALLRVYLHAWQVTGENAFRQTAERIIEYANATLLDPKTGAFGGSQDADEVYYKMDAVARCTMPRPRVDRVVYANWNSSMAISYIQASYVLDRPDLLDTGMRTLDFLLSSMYDGSRGMSHFHDGSPRSGGLLVDQIWTAQALVEAFQATGRAGYLENAGSLVRIILSSFQDHQEGGFYDIAEDPDPAGKLSQRDRVVVESSLAADLLLEYHALTGDEEARQAAERALVAFEPVYQRYGHFAAPYALAVEHYLRGPVSVTVVGERADPRSPRLLHAALKPFSPPKVVRLVDPAESPFEVERLGYPSAAAPAAYVCSPAECLGAVEDPSLLPGLIDSISSQMPPA